MSWPQTPAWYDLKQLNGGAQITAATPVTNELWNHIVQNLIFLHNRNLGGAQNASVAEQSRVERS